VLEIRAATASVLSCPLTLRISNTNARVSLGRAWHLIGPSDVEISSSVSDVVVKPGLVTFTADVGDKLGWLGPLPNQLCTVPVINDGLTGYFSAWYGCCGGLRVIVVNGTSIRTLSGYMKVDPPLRVERWLDPSIAARIISSLTYCRAYLSLLDKIARHISDSRNPDSTSMTKLAKGRLVDFKVIVKPDGYTSTFAI
jgi:hypothetical protein